MRGFKPDAVVAGAITQFGREWGLCVDKFGHGLFLTQSTLREVIQDMPSDSPRPQVVGDPIAGFVGMLASRFPE